MPFLAHKSRAEIQLPIFREKLDYPIVNFKINCNVELRVNTRNKLEGKFVIIYVVWVASKWALSGLGGELDN